MDRSSILSSRISARLKKPTKLGVRCDKSQNYAPRHAGSYPSWGIEWLQEFPGPPQSGDSLENEVQAPGGGRKILADSHWQDRRFTRNRCLRRMFRAWTPWNPP